MIVKTPDRFIQAIQETHFPADSAACPQAVFLVEPDGFFVSEETAADNHYMNLSNAADPDKALQQFHQLVDLIRACGVDAYTFPGNHDTPDAVFPNNVFGTIQGKLIIGQMRYPGRQKEAERADIIIVTKNPSDSEEAQHLKIKNKLNPKPNQRMLFSYLVYDTVLQGNGPLKGIADLLDKKVTLVTGIADATPLMNFLNESGISFEHLRYKDHHDFTEQDLEVIKSRSNLLTTEKDYMRLKSRLDKCNYITIKHAFFGEGMKKFHRELEDFMIPYS